MLPDSWIRSSSWVAGKLPELVSGSSLSPWKPHVTSVIRVRPVDGAAVCVRAQRGKEAELFKNVFIDLKGEGRGRAIEASVSEKYRLAASCNQ